MEVSRWEAQGLEETLWESVEGEDAWDHLSKGCSGKAAWRADVWGHLLGGLSMSSQVCAGAGKDPQPVSTD